MLRKNKLIHLVCILGLIIALAACGNSNGSNHSDQKTADNLGNKDITLSYVAWVSAIASNHVMEAVLEDAGYNVTLKQITSGAMYSSVADGTSDATVCAWLPYTDKSYWEKYKDNLVDLGPHIHKAPLGLVVPEYMDVDSIEDLAKNKNGIGEKTDWTITGIDAGAGQMQVTRKKVMTGYGLDKWHLKSSSGTAMTAALQKAIKNKEPIIVTLWSPHWAFSDFDLKYLKDPKNFYGDPDDIKILTRKGLKEDSPAANKILDQFHWKKENMQKIMSMIHNGLEPKEAARKWVDNHQDIVSEWTKGVQ
ncbi:glycine betaine ABC transporter substrate-binding protein [Tuberibacillus sp. Marseille-P3662]|uniref:glycine betaine ABC transporter substrate-binding protein n=1 Tax=Tuberibacillus sp. Marseille-P3662 TaxID=1965358 RepID=UPI000A1CBC61|nr:glycine betaine ABC transporter substrate-binding protein [Tuberibacillus sp. Marseille-P3662]